MLIIFTFYCINNVSYATNWVATTINKSGSTHIDTDNITYKENRVTFWVKTKEKKPITNTDKNKIIMHDESQYQHIADCLTKKASTVIAYFYLNGEYVYTKKMDKKDFIPLSPDSVMRQILDILCETY